MSSALLSLIMHKATGKLAIWGLLFAALQPLQVTSIATAVETVKTNQELVDMGTHSD